MVNLCAKNIAGITFLSLVFTAHKHPDVRRPSVRFASCLWTVGSYPIPVRVPLTVQVWCDCVCVGDPPRRSDATGCSIQGSPIKARRTGPTTGTGSCSMRKRTETRPISSRDFTQPYSCRGADVYVGNCIIQDRSCIYRASGQISRSSRYIYLG